MRIAITQRVEVVAAYDERRDCLDQAWTHLLSEAGFDALPVPNCLHDVASWVEHEDVRGLILSGGNDLSQLPAGRNIAPERDATERALLEWAFERSLPVLGVCRGMQIMNHFLGGSLAPVSGHVACRHVVVPCPGESLCANHAEVNSFHDWGIMTADLAAALKPLTIAKDGTIEAFRHDTQPWAGIMWHPERNNGREQQHDLQLLRRLFSTK